MGYRGVPRLRRRRLGRLRFLAGHLLLVSLDLGLVRTALGVLGNGPPPPMPLDLRVAFFGIRRLGLVEAPLPAAPTRTLYLVHFGNPKNRGDTLRTKMTRVESGGKFGRSGCRERERERGLICRCRCAEFLEVGWASLTMTSLPSGGARLQRSNVGSERQSGKSGSRSLCRKTEATYMFRDFDFDTVFEIRKPSQK